MSLCFEATAPQSLVPVTADKERICLARRSVQSPSPSPHLRVTEQNPRDKAGMSVLLSAVCDCGASENMSLTPAPPRSTVLNTRWAQVVGPAVTRSLSGD